jgi:phosphoglycolate phosphatase-like HAD superfamily hydrolase
VLFDRDGTLVVDVPYNGDPDLVRPVPGAVAVLRRLHARGVERYLLHIPDDPDEGAARALYSKFGTLADRQQVLRVSF